MLILFVIGDTEPVLCSLISFDFTRKMYTLHTHHHHHPAYIYIYSIRIHKLILLEGINFRECVCMCQYAAEPAVGNLSNWICHKLVCVHISNFIWILYVPCKLNGNLISSSFFSLSLSMVCRFSCVLDFVWVNVCVHSMHTHTCLSLSLVFHRSNKRKIDYYKCNHPTRSVPKKIYVSMKWKNCTIIWACKCVYGLILYIKFNWQSNANKKNMKEFQDGSHKIALCRLTKCENENNSNSFSEWKSKKNQCFCLLCLRSHID